jgi:hypothetical protein
MAHADILPTPALPKAALMRKCAEQWEAWSDSYAAQGDTKAADHWAFQAAQLRRQLAPAAEYH